MLLDLPSIVCGRGTGDAINCSIPAASTGQLLRASVDVAEVSPGRRIPLEAILLFLLP